MCLTVEPTRPFMYRAGYDILVYKRLLYCGHNNLVSPFRGCPYALKRIKVNRIGSVQKDLFAMRIYLGLHAYFSKEAERLLIRKDELYPAIIPKGAHFVLGRRGEVVSNQLIVFPKNHKFPRGIGKADFSKHTIVRKL